MNEVIVGIGEMAVSNDAACVLKTYALGTCVALIVLDPKTRTAGLAHIALPALPGGEIADPRRPAYYADHAVESLLRTVRRPVQPGQCKEMIVKLAGGAAILDATEQFSIGKRNVLAVRKELWRFGLRPRAEDVGGSTPRTVAVGVAKGSVLVSGAGFGERRL